MTEPFVIGCVVCGRSELCASEPFDGDISILSDVDGLLWPLAYGCSSTGSTASSCSDIVVGRPFVCESVCDRPESLRLRFNVDTSGDGDALCSDECKSRDRIDDVRDRDAFGVDDGGGVTADTSFLIGSSSSITGAFDEDTNESRCMLVDLWA